MTTNEPTGRQRKTLAAALAASATGSDGKEMAGIEGDCPDCEAILRRAIERKSARARQSPAGTNRLAKEAQSAAAVACAATPRAEEPWWTSLERRAAEIRVVKAQEILRNRASVAPPAKPCPQSPELPETLKIRGSFAISQAVPSIDVDKAEQLYANLSMTDPDAWRRDLISRLQGIRSDRSREEAGAHGASECTARRPGLPQSRLIALSGGVGSASAALHAVGAGQARNAVFPAIRIGGALAVSVGVAFALTAAAFDAVDQLSKPPLAAFEPAPLAVIPNDATIVTPAVAERAPEPAPAPSLPMAEPKLTSSVFNQSRMIALKSIETNTAVFTPPLSQPVRASAELKSASWRSTSTPLLITLAPSEKAHLVSLIAIRGLPPEMSMTRGKRGKSNIWMLTADELSGLAIDHPRRPSQPVTLSIAIFVQGAVRQELSVVLPSRKNATASISTELKPARIGQLIKTSAMTKVPATPHMSLRAKAPASQREPDWRTAIWSGVTERGP